MTVIREQLVSATLWFRSMPGPLVYTFIIIIFLLFISLQFRTYRILWVHESDSIYHKYGNRESLWYRMRALVQNVVCEPRLQAKLLQLCPTLWDPMDCSPPGSSVHGILQARIREWVFMPSSRGSSQPRDRTHLSYVSCIGRQVLYH